jgi:hypothetical protein
MLSNYTTPRMCGCPHPHIRFGAPAATKRNSSYINVADMRHEMWRNNRFSLFSPF